MKDPQQVQTDASRIAAPGMRSELVRTRAAKLGATAMLCAAASLSGPTLAASTGAGDGLVAGVVASEARPARTHKASFQQSPLDRRIALLTAELDLNTVQQRQVKALLLRQREAVQQVWGDPSLSPPIRVSRTQAISERTAEEIRALLDEEQRQKYIQPRQREASVGVGGAGIEAWMTPGAGK